MEFIKKHKKAIRLIVMGLLAIGGSYIGISEEAQEQIVNLIDILL